MAHKWAILTRATRKKFNPQFRSVSSYFQPSESEYVDKPVYPPILDMSYEAIKERKLEEAAQKITNLPTVEEKLIEMNMPKYYGWWACQLNEGTVPYNSLPFHQFATRTCLTNELPQLYTDLDMLATQSIPLVREKLIDLIVQEFQYVLPRTNKQGEIRSPAVEEDRFSTNFIPIVNRLLSSLLTPQNEHLASVEVDFQPRLETFWSLGGIEPDKVLRKIREGSKYMHNRNLDEPIDRPMRYRGNPCLQLRHSNPLPQLVDRESGLSVDGEIPKWSHDPRTIGHFFKHSHACIVPGFWPGTQIQHGYLAWLNRGYLRHRERGISASDHQEVLHAQAVLHSFAWTSAQAFYLGFGPYTELTYPISTQTIMTNGQFYSFYAYQLNTCALYNKNSSDANPHRNVCFTINEQKLFDVVENGQVKGFNDDVLKNLIKFYMVKPSEPEVNLRPYLSADLYIADIEDAKKRQQVEKQFKHLVANRPRHLLKPEIYHWEKIYKIDHDTRPMDPKRRFFETQGKPPGSRRLDEHATPYVPKVLREIPKKSRRGRLPVTPTIKL